MNNKKKKFLIWHFLIYIPLIIFLNKINISEKINPKKPVEAIDYSVLSQNEYSVFNVDSGKEIGKIQIESISSDSLVFSLKAEETLGKHKYFNESGDYHFNKQELEHIILNKRKKADEEFWYTKNEETKYVIINLFSDASLIPENLKNDNRKYYLLRITDIHGVNYLTSEKPSHSLRELLLSNYNQSLYSCIFYQDISEE